MTKKSTGEFLSFVSDVAQVVADHLATGEPPAPAPAAASPAVAPPEAAMSAAASTPVAPAPLDDFFLDDEKVIWDWPDVGGRVIEELR
jgi:hypothetical protein